MTIFRFLIENIDTNAKTTMTIEYIINEYWIAVKPLFKFTVISPESNSDKLDRDIGE